MVRQAVLVQTLAAIMVLFSWSLPLRLLPMVEPLPSRRLVKYAAPHGKASLSLAAAAEVAQEAFDADEEKLQEAKEGAREAFSWRHKERRRNKRKAIDKSRRPLRSASRFQMDARESFPRVPSKRESMETGKQLDAAILLHQPKRESAPKNMNRFDNHLVDAILDLKQGLLLERRNEEDAKKHNFVSHSAYDIPQKTDNFEYIGLLKHSLASGRSFDRPFTTEFRPRRTVFWHKTAPENEATPATPLSSVTDNEKSRERKSAEDTNRNLKLVTKLGNTYLQAPKRNFPFETLDGKADVATKPDSTLPDLASLRSTSVNMTQTPLRQYKPTGALPSFQVPCVSSPCRKNGDQCCSGKCGTRRCGKTPCDTQTCCTSNCGRKILPTPHHAPSTQTTMSGSQAVGGNDATQRLSVIVWDPITEPNKFSPTLMLLPKSIINLPKYCPSNDSWEDKSARRRANPFFQMKPNSETWLEDVNPSTKLDDYLADKAVQTVQSNSEEPAMDQAPLNKIFNLNQPSKATEVRVAAPEVLGEFMSSGDILPKKDCSLQRLQHAKPSVWSRWGVPASHLSNQNYLKPGESDKQKSGADPKMTILPDLFLRPLSLSISTSTEKMNVPSPNVMSPLKWPSPLYSQTTVKHTPYQVSVYVWKENEIPKDPLAKAPLIDQNAIDLLLNQTLQARNLQDMINSRKQAETAPNKSIPDPLPRWMMQVPNEGSTSSEDSICIPFSMWDPVRRFPPDADRERLLTDEDEDMELILLEPLRSPAILRESAEFSIDTPYPQSDPSPPRSRRFLEMEEECTPVLDEEDEDMEYS